MAILNNDFSKSRRPYWNYVLEIIRGPGPPSTSGYAECQMYVSITNTERLIAVLMISWSGGGHIGFKKMPLDEILHTLRKMLS